MKFRVMFLLAIFTVALISGCNNQFMSSGIIYMQQSDFDKAIAQFDQAIKAEPGNAQAYLWMGKAYGSKREYETAAKYFLLAIDKDSTDKVLNEMKEGSEFYWAVLYNAGVGFVNAKDAKEKGADYEKYLTAAEQVLDTSINYNYLVLLYAEMGNEAKMTEAYNKAIAKDPKNISVAFNVAKYYIENKNFDKAETFLAKAKEIDPKNVQVIYWLAEMSNEKAKYDDAISGYKKFLEVFATLDEKVKEADKGYYQDVLYKTGNIYLEKKKDAKSAIKYFKQAVESDTTDALSFLQLGVAYYQNKEFKNSITPIKQYMELTGNEMSKLYLILSDAYNRIKENKLSEDAFKKFEELKTQGK